MMDSIADNSKAPAEKAAEAVQGLTEVLNERGSNYGSWEQQGRVAQNLKAVFRDALANSLNGLAPAEIEAAEMVLHKLSRIACGDPAAQDDTWRDIAGYAEIARKLREDS